MKDLGVEAKREAPAAARNVVPIGDVLEGWLPDAGLVLETASGTGQHALAFAARFPHLEWQPSDPDPAALASIGAWREEAGSPSNLRAPLRIDASARDWPIDAADAVLSINMAHISPWKATLGLLDAAARILPVGAPLIFYGPWLADDVETAPSNLDFDASLKSRDSRWGLRRVEDLEKVAHKRGLRLVDRRAMPANNMMLKLLVSDPI
ncbi:DUF938 domain-containing protein [Sphingomicrobium sediminis]|uniref:Class I SAM-dependent methyltransferase n=1 Tax=Sphingomicrobium sediminis TaxID=2950949 RepID=A0A9X2EGJ9_9SPHN|nr:DUF938 domain-containing protein [Sphingomicrobium sediminis]MCM8557105.1 class I SAM-dependent methyltransferase [Sphingomicrobium sediminis]